MRALQWGCRGSFRRVAGMRCWLQYPVAHLSEYSAPKHRGAVDARELLTEGILGWQRSSGCGGAEIRI
jgi:hypothetical protein